MSHYLVWHRKIIRQPRTIICLFILLCPFFAGYTQTLDSLLNELPKAKEDTHKVVLLNKITLQYIYKDLSKVLGYAAQSAQLSDRLGFPGGKAAAMVYTGEYYRIFNDLEKARFYFDSAYVIYKELNNGIGLAAINNFYGLYYREKGSFDKSIEKYLLALSFYSENGMKNAESGALSSIGIVFSEMNRYAEAEKYFLQSIALKKEINDQRGLSTQYINLGHLKTQQKKFDESLKYFEAALNIQEKLKDVHTIMICKTNMGNIYNDRGEPDKALTLYEDTYAYYKDIGDTSKMSLTLLQQGIAYRKKKDFKKSLELMQKGHRLLQRFNPEAPLHKDFYTHLYLTHKEAGNYKAALEAYEKTYEMDTSVLTRDVMEKVFDIREKYETEKKEQLIQLKQQENKLLSEQNKAALAEARSQKYWKVAAIAVAFSLIMLVALLAIIQNSRTRKKEADFYKKKADLEHKALRAQMNPHFIFNSLNSIQRMYVEGNNEQANEFMADFGSLMRKILDNSSKDRISLKEELETLKLYMELEKIRIGEMLEYTISVDDEIDQSGVKVPPLILQPFVENAIWHGILPKGEKGLIEIDVRQVGHELKFSIADNGVGFNPKQQQHDSKGLRITEQRLGKTIHIQPRESGGVIVSFTWSI